MTSLKQARESGNLDQFIKEREAEANGKGDAEALNHGLRSMAQTTKEAPKTSSPDDRDD